jgi:hypothetical protein
MKAVIADRQPCRTGLLVDFRCMRHMRLRDIQQKLKAEYSGKKDHDHPDQRPSDHSGDASPIRIAARAVIE